MPPLSLQLVLLGLPGALRLVLLLFVPAFAFVVRRKWRLAASRREEVRRLVLLASEEAARAEIEAANEYRSRLEYEHSPSLPAAAATATATGPISKPMCAVCYSPTTTRCSRCKAVRYCSGKCQIIHWRQGHKEECRPPKFDIQPNTPENTADLRKQQIESSNLSGSDSGTSDANSNQTANHETPLPSGYSCASTIISGEDNLKMKHIVDDSGSKCSSDSSLLSPPLKDSASTIPMENGVFTLDASSQDNSSKCQENYATADIIYAATNELGQRKLNKSSRSECLGENPSVSSIASLERLNEEASNCEKEEVGCQSGSSSGPSFRDVNHVISKSVVDHSKYQEPVSEFGGEQYSGRIGSTSAGVAAEEVSGHLYSEPATQITRNSNSSCRVVSSRATHPDKVDKHFPLKSNVSKNRDPSVEFLDMSASDFSMKENNELPPKARESGSVSSAESVDQKSSGCNEYSVSRCASLKVVNASSVHNKLSGVTNPGSNGSCDLKTSVQRVVQQFKTSKVSKTYQQMLLPYDIFVKLYNEKVEMHPSGLINCGNSCYANVVLQCLAFTRPLTSYLLQGFHTKSCPKKEWCFTCEFERLVFKAKQGQSPLSPLNIISQIHSIGSHLGHGREEDAHEFLRYAIDAMQVIFLKEAGADSAAKFAEETTLIQLTFGGYLLSRIKCMRCLGKSERSEKMMDLTVEIDGDVGTLDEALTRFTATEILDGENKYQCSRCKSYEKAKKRLKVLEAPNILTIVLKRFQSGKFGKLNKAVKFPEFLNLAKYMSGTSDKSPIYRLYAVVVHLDIMKAAFSGHYVCYVMNATGKWYKIDDSMVRPMELDRVLLKPAYMLFYSRCSPRAPSLIRNTSHEKFKMKGKHQGSLSSVARSRPQNYPNWTAGNPARASPWDSSESDSSSLFSCSDEGSCSTESTRDSTSTDGISESIFGESGHWNSPMWFPEDSDGFTSSPSFSGLFSEHEGMIHGHPPDSPESEYSASDLGAFQEDSFPVRGLSYRDCVEDVGTDTVGMTHTHDNGEVSIRDKDDTSFLHSDIRSFRKLTGEYSSRRYTDLASHFNHKSVLSSSSNKDRTAQTFR